MAKPEWGQKRNCTSCGCRFYDMGRTPVTCPKCGSTVETDLPFKVRRGGSAPVEAKAAAPVAAVAADEMDSDDLPMDDEDESLDGDDEAAEDDEMIEDTSDLGEDDDDMAEVMEHLDEEIEDEV